MEVRGLEDSNRLSNGKFIAKQIWGWFWKDKEYEYVNAGQDMNFNGLDWR